MPPFGSVNSRGVHELLFNRWSLQLAATVGLFAFAIGRVNLGEVKDAIGQANYVWALAALGAFVASKFLASIRWQLYLARVGRPPLLGLMGAYVIGTMVNSLLPFRAGDFTKIQIVSSRYQLPRAALSSTVFTVEAVLDAVTLLVFFLISLAVMDASFVPDEVVIAFVIMTAAGFLVALATSRFLPHEMPSWRVFRWLSPWARQILADAWPKFLDGMITLRDRRLLTRALALHAIEWLIRAAVMWLLGFSFSLEQGPETFVLLTVILALASLFPITFLNFGTYQVVVTEVLVAAGGARDEAFAYALAAHAITHAWILAMGLIAMVAMQVSYRKVAGTQEGA